MTAPARTEPAASGNAPTGHRSIIIILLVAAFVVILIETTMNVALASIMGDFGVTERAAQWLTIIGVHLETALWIGLLVLFYLLLPQQIETDWDWQSLILAADHEWRWLEHLTNVFYALVLVVWEPIYVACGFSLYLNRRTQLEAWDIELVFRR